MSRTYVAESGLHLFAKCGALVGSVLTLLLFGAACATGSSAKLESVGARPGTRTEPALLEQPGGLSLPPPSSLTVPARQSVAVSGDWRSEGADFVASLPNNLVIAGAQIAVFNPQWVEGDPLTKLAYACHEFLLPGYDFGDYVQFGWSDPPADGQLWIALSDWQRDTWRWYAPESAELLRPADLARHYDANGRLLVVVALTGANSAGLDWISIGNRPPEAVVEVVGPRYGFGSLNATFDPSGSYDTDGSLVKYEWDWQDDGSFDQVSGASPVQHLFTEEGTHTVRLRVTDNLGRTDGAPIQVSVADSWVRTIGGAEDEFITDIAIAPDGSLWACGYVVIASQRSELAVFHFDAAGNLLYESYWKVSDIQWAEHVGEGIAIDAAGNAYVLGQTVITGATTNIIQRYSTEGELSWSRQIPGTDAMLEDILVADEQIYLCGGKWEVALNAPRGFYCVLDLDGNGLYAKLSNESANFSAMAWHDEPGLGDELRLCGYVRDLASNHDLLHAVVRFAEQQELAAHRWGAPTIKEYGVGIALTDTELETVSMLAVSVDIDADNERSALVRFSIDEGVSCSIDTSNTNARDVAILGEKVLTLSTNSPGVTSLQQYSIVPGFDGAYGYTANLLTTPECMENFSNLALVVGGGAVNNTGAFDEEPVSNFQLEDQTWTEYPLSYEFFVFTVADTSLPNTSTRPAGTQDTGGGGQDFWVSLHVPPQIDF